MHLKLSDKTALATGASGDQPLPGAEGARPAILACCAEALRTLTAEMQIYGAPPATVIAADIADPGEHSRRATDARKGSGRRAY